MASVAVAGEWLTQALFAQAEPSGGSADRVFDLRDLRFGDDSRSLRWCRRRIEAKTGNVYCAVISL